jgi:hypothetical protein
LVGVTSEHKRHEGNGEVNRPQQKEKAQKQLKASVAQETKNAPQ